MQRKNTRKQQSTEQKIKRLEKELSRLKRKRKQEKLDNKIKVSTAERYSADLSNNATLAEIKFLEIAKAKHIKLEFQYPIYINQGGSIKRFYIADFCDTKRKLVFEIDGGYHFTETQQLLDEYRTRDLASVGYKVFRISNKDIFDGKTTAFLYKVYKQIGIDIISC